MSARKRMAVTGAAGFIGSYLSKRLLSQGHDPLILVDEPAAFKDRKCARGLSDGTNQILSPKDFLDNFRSLGCETVFHMGACSNTEEKRKDYIQEVNLFYSQKLWDLCSEERVPLLYASSAGTYGDGSKGFSDNPDQIPQFSPLSLYAQSKQDFDLWVLEQKKSPPFWSGFKFFNVYGPGEDHKGRQASMAFHLKRQLLETGKMKLYKSYKPAFPDGGQQRDFVYVGDVTKVLLDFSRGQNSSGIYNIGTGVARSFNDLARAVAGHFGKPAEIEYIEMPEALRPQYQYFTQAELHNLRSAGFKDRFLTLEEGVHAYFKEETL